MEFAEIFHDVTQLVGRRVPHAYDRISRLRVGSIALRSSFTVMYFSCAHPIWMALTNKNAKTRTKCLASGSGEKKMISPVEGESILGVVTPFQGC